MTDEEIEIDFHEDEILNEKMEELIKAGQPNCPGCGYSGDPYMNSTICPKCGGNMFIPGETYGQDIESDLRDIGVEPEKALSTSPQPSIPHR